MRSCKITRIAAAFAAAAMLLLSFGSVLAENTEALQAVSIPDVLFLSEPVSGGIEEADTVITLKDGGTAVIGDGVAVQGGTVTVTAEGSYLLTGTITDGQIVVNTLDDGKVELILDGADVTCPYAPALYIISAPRNVTITLAKDSVNLFSDGSAYQDQSEGAPDACIFSKADLKIRGSGEIYITGSFGKGISGKDDVDIQGGRLYIRSADDGIRGKDSVTLSGGKVWIDAGGDGLRSSNDTDDTKGWIVISGGETYVTSAFDAIQSETNLTVSGGNITLRSGEGSQENTAAANPANAWGNRGNGWGMNGWGQPPTNNTSGSETEPSAKGMKAGTAIEITDGIIRIDSADDALHSNGTVVIQDGDILAYTDDDGVHADNSILVSGGSVTLAQCYEGLESADIVLSGGEVHVTASDDGINAANGADGSNTGGRMDWHGFESDTGESVLLTGGYVMIRASGDGIDSNGSIDMQGGTLIVYGPTDNGNGALDYASTFTISGGYLLASGSSGMAQSASGDGQSVLAFTLSQVDPNTLLHIENSSGDELLTFASEKTYSCVVFSCEALRAGETYDVYMDGEYTGEKKDGVYSNGSYSNGTKLGSLAL